MVPVELVDGVGERIHALFGLRAIRDLLGKWRDLGQEIVRMGAESGLGRLGKHVAHRGRRGFARRRGPPPRHALLDRRPGRLPVAQSPSHGSATAEPERPAQELAAHASPGLEPGLVSGGPHQAPNTSLKASM